MASMLFDNGDKTYKHMVVMQMSFGNLICTTSDKSDEPAVYHDSGPAELRCTQLRDKHPELKFAVVNFVVL